MPGGRNSPQVVADSRRHCAEVTLAGEQLSERVADVHDPDVARVHFRRLESAPHHLAGEIREVAIG